MSIEAMKKACSVMANARDYIGASEPEPWPMEQQYDELQDAINMLASAIKEAEKREWVGMTDDEVDLLVPYCHNEFDLNDYREFALAIEAKLKEKNNG